MYMYICGEQHTQFLQENWVKNNQLKTLRFWFIFLLSIADD